MQRGMEMMSEVGTEKERKVVGSGNVIFSS